MVLIRNAYNSGARHLNAPQSQPANRSLLAEITQFLAQTKMPETRFGKLATGDTGIVGDMREGRVPRAKTEARVRAFMAGYQA